MKGSGVSVYYFFQLHVNLKSFPSKTFYKKGALGIARTAGRAAGPSKAGDETMNTRGEPSQASGGSISGITGDERR